MALRLTPESFLEVFVLCLHWEWEHAVEIYMSQIGVVENPKYPHQRGYTTVDKVLRILNGLGVVEDRMRKVLHKDRRLQSLTLRRSHLVMTGQSIEDARRNSTKLLVLQCDLANDINRERMLRNMHFFVTESGAVKARESRTKYESAFTREGYFKEIARQNEILGVSETAKAAVMTRYRARVNAETA